MVSSVTGSAAFSTAMLSGSQCRGSRDIQASQDKQALQEKLFTKLDVNGDGSIDKTELSDFLSFAASKTNAAQSTDSSQLFSTLDTDGDGALSQPELSDGIRSLFDELRTQLMTKVQESTETGSAEEPNPDEMFAQIDANGDGTIDKDELGSFLSANPPPPPPGGEHGRHGGLIAKIESLLDQYRNNASTSSIADTDATSSLSVAA